MFQRYMTTNSISAINVKEEVAAADPLDVTQIIEEAKIKVQSAPKIRYVLKSNPRSRPRLLPPPPLSPPSPPAEEEDTKISSLAPPHPKKRLLASLRKENKGKVTFKDPVVQ